MTLVTVTEVYFFFNLIAYGNKRLFDHIKKSFERNIEDKNKVK